MPSHEPKIDAYIANSQPFAQPILIHFRGLVHKACPDVEEKIKWGMPHFDYLGEMMCSMAAFKAHAVFGFWKAPLFKDAKLLEIAKSETAMGHSGKLLSIRDMPSDKKILSYIKEAMLLNEKGLKIPGRVKKPAKEMPVPKYLAEILKKNKKAQEVFTKFPPSHRNEYIVWFEEAKTEATRNKRLSQGIEMMTAGKSKNWKYQKK
ncbi:MAG: YdeI/OmpD-associated family protein [bacterium]